MTQRVPRTRQDTDRIAVEISRETAPVYPDVASNPLCQRVAEIQTRAERHRVAGTVANVETQSAARGYSTEDFVSTPIELESTRKPIEIPSPERVVEV